VADRTFNEACSGKTVTPAFVYASNDCVGSVAAGDERPELLRGDT